MPATLARPATTKAAPVSPTQAVVTFRLSQFRWDAQARTLTARRSDLDLSDTFYARRLLVVNERTGITVEFGDRRGKASPHYDGTESYSWCNPARGITVVILNDEQ